MSTPRSRQPAGTPVGGQFAESERAPSGLSLDGESDRDVQRNASDEAVADIWNMLHSDEAWDVEDLETVANLVGGTGRPHPGDVDPDAYRNEWDTYLADRGEEPLTPAEESLDHIAVHLGEKPEWQGLDELEWISLSV